MAFWDDWGSNDNSLGGPVTDEAINWDQTPEEAAQQESLGQSIFESSQAGWQQEQLGAGIVQESIGKSLVDGFLNGSTQVEPWLRTMDATLGGVAKTITQVDRLLGPTNRITAPSGIPREIQQSDRISPILASARKYLNVYPPSGGTSLSTPQRVSNFSATFDSTDYITLGLVAVGAFLLLRAAR